MKLSQLPWAPTCPRNNLATDTCLSHKCQASPFQCSSKNCICTTSHHRCKTMHWNAVKQHLQDWKKNIGSQGKEFIKRIDKVFSNLRGKLQKEEFLFQQHCRDTFLGPDYSNMMRLVQKKDQKSMTPQLIASALRNLTQPTRLKSFNSFTLSQMQNIDQTIEHLFKGIQKLYHSKEDLKPDFDRLKRSSSATLTRESGKASKDIDKNDKKLAVDLINLKLDLTFPKIINSRIVSQATGLNRLMGCKVKKYHLVYRASEANFSISQFYQSMKTTHNQMAQASIKSGKKIDTLTLILIKNQHLKVFGGFTPLTWEEPKKVTDQSDQDEINPEHKNIGNAKYKGDSFGKTAMFSLDLMERYDLKMPEEAIYCGRKSIGFGKGDLKILQRGQALRKNYIKFPISYNYEPRPYQAWSKSGMTLGGGRYSVFFKVLEWQGFIVQL